MPAVLNLSLVFAAAKLLAPLGTVALLLVHQVTAAAAPPIGLTNVAGAAGDCTSPARDAVCATLFQAGTPLWPGGPARQATVTIAATGMNPTRFGIYLTRFTSRDARSAAGCTATDPADRLDLTIAQDGETVYTGTLAGFAAQHGQAPDLLRLPLNHSSTFTISVALDASADNSYMGCATSTDIAWYASA